VFLLPEMSKSLDGRDVLGLRADAPVKNRGQGLGISDAKHEIWKPGVRSQ
jgi:hypothetical protein